MNRNVKTAIIVGCIAVALIVIVPLVIGAIGGWGFYGMMGPGMMGPRGGIPGLMWLIPLSWLIVLGLIVWAIIALVRGLSGQGAGPGGGDAAMETLKMRYASGEISKEEFEAKKKDLAEGTH